MKLSIKCTLIFSALILGNAALAVTSQPYVAVQLGYGNMQTGNYQAPEGNDSIGAISIAQTNGGFAYRVAGGYLFDINDKFKIGPEMGYLGYTKNEYKVSVDNINVATLSYTAGPTHEKISFKINKMRS
jgi:hypothetical protein